ncbi:hypothetical protein [Mariniblastus fucicola]|nr:hypothetical protein [Mariniblastus fucicola]
MIDLLGVDWFQTVCWATVVQPTSNELSELQNLFGLQQLTLESRNPDIYMRIGEISTLRELSLLGSEYDSPRITHDLSFLKKFRRLESLELRGIDVLSFSPITGSGSLRQLDLINCTYSKSQLDDLATQTPNLDIKEIFK